MGRYISGPGKVITTAATTETQKKLVSVLSVDATFRVKTAYIAKLIAENSGNNNVRVISIFRGLRITITPKKPKKTANNLTPVISSLKIRPESKTANRGATAIKE